MSGSKLAQGNVAANSATASLNSQGELIVNLLRSGCGVVTVLRLRLARLSSSLTPASAAKPVHFRKGQFPLDASEAIE